MLAIRAPGGCELLGSAPELRPYMQVFVTDFQMADLSGAGHLGLPPPALQQISGR